MRNRVVAHRFLGNQKRCLRRAGRCCGPPGSLWGMPPGSRKRVSYRLRTRVWQAAAGAIDAGSGPQVQAVEIVAQIEAWAACNGRAWCIAAETHVAALL